MAKRTIAFVAVFAALLSVTLSVQAEDTPDVPTAFDYTTMYWTGGAGDNKFYTGSLNNGTTSNWVDQNGTLCSTKYIDGHNGSTASGNERWDQNCYITNTNGNTVTVDWSNFGVASLTIGNGIGGEGNTATVSRGNAELKTKLTINKGGSATFGAFTISDRNGTPAALTMNGGSLTTGALSVNSGASITINDGSYILNAGSGADSTNNGTITLTSGSFEITAGYSFRVGGNNANAKLSINGGTFTTPDSTPTYIATSTNGTIEQTAGTANFNGSLVLGWGNHSGTYNLSGGKITTTGSAGLWNANDSGISTFNVTGGTANFNKSGESFTIGLGGTSTLANDFNLKSGTVNAADTFAIKYGGILNVGQSGAGDGVLNANKIEINNGGNLNMSSGTIKLGSGGITNTSGAYTITLSGGTFGTNNASWATSLDATISSNAVTFAPEAGKSITWRGVMSGAGALTKTDAGTLELFGANTYTGGTTISNGGIRLRTNGSLGTGAIAIDTNGSLTFGGDMTPQPKTISNAISGTGTIVKQGASNFTANLDGNLTGFSGDMIISGGTLSVLMNGTNRSLNVTNLSGPGNLELRLASGNGNTTLPNLTNNGFTGVISLVESGGSNGNKIDTGTKSFEGFTFNINSGTTIYVDEAAFGANVNLSGTGNNEGHGALRLHNNMTGNITVMANNSVLGIDRTAVTVSGNIASGANSGETTLVIKNVVNNNGSGTFTGVISDGTSGSKLGVQLSGGTHTFTGANTYSGGTTISAGTLVLSGDGTLGTGTVANNATLEFAHTADLTGANAFSNVISGTGAVNKTGSGKLTLSGANTYTGETTVSGGVLELTGDAVVANGQVTVGDKGTLVYNVDGEPEPLTIGSTNKIFSTGQVIKTGEGTLKLCALYSDAEKMIDVQSLTVSSGRVDIKEYFYGKLIVDSEGTFSPGNSVGSLTIGDGTYGGGFILNEAGAELLMEIGGSAASANDVLIVEGDITLADGSVITLVNNSNLGLGESFTAILSADNSASLDVLGHIQTTDFTELKYVQINDATHGTVYAITGRTLNANEIPEPSTWALLVLGVAGLIYWRKRK